MLFVKREKASDPTKKETGVPKPRRYKTPTSGFDRGMQAGQVAKATSVHAYAATASDQHPDSNILETTACGLPDAMLEAVHRLHHDSKMNEEVEAEQLLQLRREKESDIMLYVLLIVAMFVGYCIPYDRLPPSLMWVMWLL